LLALELELRAKLNARHLETRPADAALEARIKSYETAFGMQREAPEAFDINRETERHPRVVRSEAGCHGWLRLAVPGGASFGGTRRPHIELIDSGSGSASNWIPHGDMNAHAPLGAGARPTAGGADRGFEEGADCSTRRS